MPRGRPKTRKTKNGNGLGSIVPRADGRWMGRLTVGRNTDGKLRRITVYGVTSEDVDKKLSALKTKYASGLNIPSDVVTVKEWAEIWLEVYKKKSVEHNTYLFYKRLADYYIVPRIGYRILKKLTPAICQQCINEIIDAGLSSRTQHGIANALSQMLECAIDNNYIASNPAVRVKIPRGEKRKVRPADEQMQQAIADALRGTKVGAMIAVMDYAGLRPGEVFGLHRNDIDLDGMTINISRAVAGVDKDTYVKATKTNLSTAKIPIPEDLKNILEQYLKTAPDSVILFPNKRGFYYNSNSFREIYYDILDKARLPHITPYQHRHTFATELYNATKDIKVVSELLRHSSIRLTSDTYTDVKIDLMRQAVSKLNKSSKGVSNEQSQ